MFSPVLAQDDVCWGGGPKKSVMAFASLVARAAAINRAVYYAAHLTQVVFVRCLHCQPFSCGVLWKEVCAQSTPRECGIIPLLENRVHKLSGILRHWGFASPPLYLVIYLYHYGLMEIYLCHNAKITSKNLFFIF